jgi:ABC-type Mn2+/Zn2+ transport system permease subunit
MARTAGIDVSALDLQYLLVFAVTVALGLRYLGVLLMGSLIIIPAATAKHLARSLNAMLVTSVALAVLATVLGALGAPLLHLEGGPLTITIAAALFFGSLLRRRAA